MKSKRQKIHPLARIAGHVYFIYAMLLFTCTMLVVVIPVWLTTLFSDPLQSRLLHPIFRVWMGFYLPLIGCVVVRKGKHHFKKGDNYVVVCNHNSLADIPVTSPWIPGPNKTLAKKEMASVPLFGVIYKAGSILVDRKNNQSKRDSLIQMQQVLEKGLHLCLFPEGTRNKTDQPLQQFYDGAFTTAIKAGKPIIPALIFNTGRILPHYINFWGRPCTIRLEFLEPIETKGLTLDDVAELKQRVHKLMTEYYIKHK